MHLTPCLTCPRIRRIVQPDGPIPCRTLFLGEAPHRDEDREGFPFAGRTGHELDQLYLPLAMLPRSSVFICNAVACSRPDYSNPTPADALTCAGTHLGHILHEVRPTVIVPMGAIACSLWPGIRLDMDHGLAQWQTWGSWSGVVFPMYHPSAGMHQTGYMIALTGDFDRLGKFLKGLPG